MRSHVAHHIRSFVFRYEYDPEGEETRLPCVDGRRTRKIAKFFTLLLAILSIHCSVLQSSLCFSLPVAGGVGLPCTSCWTVEQQRKMWTMPMLKNQQRLSHSKAMETNDIW